MAASVGSETRTKSARLAYRVGSAVLRNAAQRRFASACYTRRLEHADVKIIVIAGLVAVIASLFSALYYLYHDKGQGTRMVKALALRVALSIALVVFLVVSYHLGWIAPTGLR